MHKGIHLSMSDIFNQLPRLSGQRITDRITDALQGIASRSWWQRIMHSALAHIMSFNASLRMSMTPNKNKCPRILSSITLLGLLALNNLKRRNFRTHPKEWPMVNDCLGSYRRASRNKSREPFTSGAFCSLDCSWTSCLLWQTFAFSLQDACSCWMSECSYRTHPKG